MSWGRILKAHYKYPFLTGLIFIACVQTTELSILQFCGPDASDETASMNATEEKYDVNALQHQQRKMCIEPLSRRKLSFRKPCDNLTFWT